SDPASGFLVEVLSGLVGQLSPSQASAVHSWVVDQEGDRPGLVVGRRVPGSLARLAHLYARLYAVVPDELLGSYEPWLADEAGRAALARHEDLFERMPRARARSLWPLRFADN